MGVVTLGEFGEDLVLLLDDSPTFCDNFRLNTGVWGTNRLGLFNTGSTLLKLSFLSLGAITSKADRFSELCLFKSSESRCLSNCLKLSRTAWLFSFGYFSVYFDNRSGESLLVQGEKLNNGFSQCLNWLKLCL